MGRELGGRSRARGRRSLLDQSSLDGKKVGCDFDGSQSVFNRAKNEREKERNYHRERTVVKEESSDATEPNFNRSDSSELTALISTASVEKERNRFRRLAGTTTGSFGVSLGRFA